MKYLGIDVGGTWIKGTVVDERKYFDLELSKTKLRVHRIRNSLNSHSTLDDVINILNEIIGRFKAPPEEISGIGIATTGIVNYQGSRILKATESLHVLKTNNWKKRLKNHFQCNNIALINDTDSAAIGLAECGYLSGDGTVGIMPIGTGLGFTVWRNGRRWRPGKTYTLLGSISMSSESFNSMASASKLSKLSKDNDLVEVLTQATFREERESYFQNLAQIINNATILYNLDELIICGGLVDTTSKCSYPLEKTLKKYICKKPFELKSSIKIRTPQEGNTLQLIGALALVRGESIASQNKTTKTYNTLSSEKPYRNDLQLQSMASSDIIEIFWRAEQEAGNSLKKALPAINKNTMEAVERLKMGGRLIYIGSGTSGRIAAMDAIEIPCTYGFPEDRVLTVISGGISDASIEIESDFEEDASSIPDMLLLNLNSKDVVIGISASGAAYFVQSGLSFAKERGALSILIQDEESKPAPPFCNSVIPLYSGNEVVAGSTRMKAGTATKKILNFISSTIMIRLDKVAGPYMINVTCTNKKLVDRALDILKKLYNIDKEEGMQRLKKADMKLSKVIQNIQMTRSDSESKASRRDCN